MVHTRNRCEREGTSPRTRGKLGHGLRRRRCVGNIPAHAGKTDTLIAHAGKKAEHPRARGENGAHFVKSTGAQGTSPRTRGKLAANLKPFNAARNIPAHAGKTSFSWSKGSERPEHPRARGENKFCELGAKLVDGTSPRTRGKPSTAHPTPALARNIPAHAGKTGEKGRLFSRRQEHPRARGENTYLGFPRYPGGGTSPRTRGKRYW